MNFVQEFAEETSDTADKDPEVSRILAVALRNGDKKLQLRGKQRNGVQQPELLTVPLDFEGRFLGAEWHSGNGSNHFDVRAEAANPERNGTGQRSHFPWVGKHRLELQLPGDEFDIVAIAFEIDILARERLEVLQIRVVLEVALGPKVDRLAANQEVGLALRIAEVEHAGELIEPVLRF